METFSKAAVFSLLSICFAFVLLILIVMDLMRPQFSRLQPESQNYPGTQSDWLPARTFKLLSGELPRPEGIDTEVNPFKGAKVAAALPKQESAQAEPEPEPAPPAPATREISLVYRGFYRSSSGEPFVYLEVDDVTRVYPLGGAIAESWTIAGANGDEVILKQDGGTRRQFPFNRKKSLEVPIE
ncbi:MAG TPA: hypothetical protein VJ952_10630 [Opitutales bacterium]|nr:hypothetical protein [Opitutales bacterium]